MTATEIEIIWKKTGEVSKTRFFQRTFQMALEDRNTT